MTSSSTVQHPRPRMLDKVRKRRGLMAAVEPFESRVEYTGTDVAEHKSFLARKMSSGGI